MFHQIVGKRTVPNIQITIDENEAKELFKLIDAHPIWLQDNPSETVSELLIHLNQFINGG